jgi:ribosomal protein S18 acetylase RimI-like enzyme
MSGTTVTIRPATLADASALVEVKGAAASDAHELDPSHFAELIERHPGLIYLAEVAGAVVGYLALLRAAHDSVSGRNPLQLWQLYVVPEFHGSGVAALLMSMGLDHARHHGHDLIWLGVNEQNARGIAFYRKHGFQPRGLHQVSAGGHAHSDLVMSVEVQ